MLTIYSRNYDGRFTNRTKILASETFPHSWRTGKYPYMASGYLGWIWIDEGGWDVKFDLYSYFFGWDITTLDCYWDWEEEGDRKGSNLRACSIVAVELGNLFEIFIEVG